MNDSRALVVCSGGLDSFTLAHYVLREIKPSRICLLFFDYGQKQAKQERKSAEKCFHSLFKLSKDVEFASVTLPMPLDSVGEYIPARNAIFAAHALSYAEYSQCNEIYYGFIDPQKEDGQRYWDTTDEFIESLNRLSAPLHVRHYAPFSQFIKKEVYLRFHAYGLDVNDVWSCMHPKANGDACGVCPNCKALYDFSVNLWGDYMGLEGIPDEQYLRDRIDVPFINEARLLINNDCNLNCGHCFYGHKELAGKEMDITHWGVAIKKCIEVGVENFHFGGKEPFFDEKIFDIVKEIKKYPNVTYDVVTNGINVLQYLEQIKEAGFWRVCISIDSFHQNEEKDKAIDALLANGIPVHIFTVASKENVTTIPDLYCHYSKKGISGFYVHPLYMYGNAIGKENLVITSEEYLDLFFALMHEKRKMLDNHCDVDFSVLGKYLEEMTAKDDIFRSLVDNVYIEVDDYSVMPHFYLIPHSHCVRFWSGVTIMPDGEVLGCGTDVAIADYKSVSAGNILQGNLMDIIKKGRAQIDLSYGIDSTKYCLRDCPNIGKPPC